MTLSLRQAESCMATFESDIRVQLQNSGFPREFVPLIYKMLSESSKRDCPAAATLVSKLKFSHDEFKALIGDVEYFENLVKYEMINAD